MKRFWWSSIMLLLFLMYFTVGSGTSALVQDGPNFGGNKNIRIIPPHGLASLSAPTQRMGGHIHLRPTAATPETLTLYEQARANLVAQ